MKIRLTELRRLVSQNITVIVEGRVEDLEKKFPSVDVRSLADSDPSKPRFKYLEWMIKQVNKNFTLEDLIPTVEYFHKHLHKFDVKDINAYKTLKDLEDAVKTASTKSSKGKQRQLSKEGAEKIYEDDEVIVVYVGTKESCQLYGANTRWCITMRDAHYFEQYTGANVVFYFALKKEPKNNNDDKIAIAVKRDHQNKVSSSETEFFDASDESLEREDFLEKYSNAFVALRSALADARNRPMNLLAKLKNGLATLEEELEFIRLYKNEERVLSRFVRDLKHDEAILSLLDSKHPYISVIIAGEVIKTEDAFQEVLKTNSHVMIDAATGNKNAPLAFLYQISNRDDMLFYAISLTRNWNSDALILEHVVKAVIEDFNKNKIRNSLRTSKVLDVLENASKRRDTNSNTLNLMVDFLQTNKNLVLNDRLEILLKIASNVNTSPKTLKKLMLEKDLSIIKQVIRHENTTSKMITQIIDNYSERVSIAYALASSPNISSDDLRRLASTADSTIKYVIAKHINTPKDVLRSFLKDDDFHLKQAAMSALNAD